MCVAISFAFSTRSVTALPLYYIHDTNGVNNSSQFPIPKHSPVPPSLFLYSVILLYCWISAHKWATREIDLCLVLSSSILRGASPAIAVDLF